MPYFRIIVQDRKNFEVINWRSSLVVKNLRIRLIAVSALLDFKMQYTLIDLCIDEIDGGKVSIFSSFRVAMDGEKQCLTVFWWNRRRLTWIPCWEIAGIVLYPMVMGPNQFGWLWIGISHPASHLMEAAGLKRPTFQDLQTLKMKSSSSPGWIAHYIYMTGMIILALAIITVLCYASYHDYVFVRKCKHLISRSPPEILPLQKNQALLHDPATIEPPSYHLRL